MRFGRAPAALGLLAVVGLCVAGTASSAATQRVTARTTFVPGSTTCTPPAPKAQNLTVEHCTGGVETWTGDITGTGKYSFDRITNLASGTAVLVNGVEVIEGACVLRTCGGDLYSKWHEHDQRSGCFPHRAELPRWNRALRSRPWIDSNRRPRPQRIHGPARLLDTASGITTKGPPRRAFLLSQRAASLRRGAAWARWPSGSSKLVRSCNPRLGRFDSGAAPSDSRYLQSLVPRSSEKGPPPPTVIGVFHGKQPSFCAVPATRRMSANTTAIASAIKNFLMP